MIDFSLVNILSDDVLSLSLLNLTLFISLSVFILMMMYGVICWYQWSTTPYSIINPINWYHMYSILISYLHSSYSSNRIWWLIIQISLLSNSWDHESEWYISILWCLFVFMVDEVNRWDELSYMNKNSKTMFNRWYCMINYSIQYQKSDYSSLDRYDIK